ncbi:uncharacterized protein LOC112514126 [Cynara cardunculus var. scolymus]|uniref:uncharacterized protein LOC112514126 n=1 Tax=Cynara cardunculus var. scolymus TaxID=59895 RepID=UPI000D627769|nr:uncharacterized protein LOC112514126 [Cynara cardunculus var. scolymus]
MKFIYDLSGWEGSATDSRVLRDAVTRNNGLKVPMGNYYLADAGYVNANGFLVPYRGTRYHLRKCEHTGHTPTNKEEHFNMKHSQARNIIQRCFGILNKRWAILRTPSFYPIKLQGRMVIACALLHNFIRMNMVLDLEENTTLTLEDMPIGEEQVESIDVGESGNEWTQWRDDIAQEMFQSWMSSR